MPALILAALLSTGPAGSLFAQYRLIFGPVLGRSCVFTPSCSHYAEEAFARFGPLGMIPAVERWTRCHAAARAGDGYGGGCGRIPDPLDGSDPDGERFSWGRSVLPF
jgi:putative component of membrane protein insertase Oxa1/YidC/SpoIIIJ protein YidD